MIDQAIDRCDGFATRHQKIIGAVSVVWFALSCALAARFVSLPDFIPLDETTQLMVSGCFNALWWGFVNPRVERRRAERACLPETIKDTVGHG